jgi:hypothetical protein
MDEQKKICTTLIIIVVILIIVAIYTTSYDYSHYYHYYSNTNKYCNSYNICFSIDKEDKKEFIKVRSQLQQFYLNLLKAMPSDNRKRRLIRRFNMNKMYEVYPLNKYNDTSYSINKGEEMGVCIRSGKDFYKIHNIDILKFVFLHELAHIISITEHHTEEFWSNFKYLLIIAYNNGLINIIDFSLNPIEYCSLQINYNPYFDNSIPVYRHRNPKY